MPLKTRLFLLLTCLALIPLGLALGWQAFDRRANRRTVEDYHAGMAEFVASNIADWKAQENKRMTFLYDLEKSSPKDLDINAFKLFQQATAAGSDILSAALVAPDGTASISLQADSLKDGADDAAGDALVAQARSTRSAAFGPLRLAAGEPAVAFVYPLADGHVVRLLLSMRDVWRRLANRKLGATGRVFLVDADGRPLPGQEPPKDAVPLSRDVFGLGGKPADAPVARIAPGDLEPAAVKAVISGGPRGFDPRLASRDGKLAASWLRLDSFPWTVLTVQRRSEALAAEDRSLLGLALFVSVSLILGMGMATAISGRVSGPVQALADAAKRVAAHDYGEPLPASGWPEFASLATAFNAMTAQLKAFDALQLGKILEEKAKAETLVRTIPDGVLLADNAGVVLYGNPQGLKLLGLPEKFASPPRLLSALPAGSTLRSALEQVLRGEGPSRADARVTVSKDPFIEKLYRVYSSPYDVAGAKQSGRVLVLRDVTSESQAQTAKNELFLMIAHDMRGSLSVIEGGTDIMSRLPAMPEKALKYARAMRSAGRTLVGMVNDILNLNKMEAGLMELGLAPASVNQMLAASRDAHQVPSEMRGVVVADVPLAADLVLAMDRPLIERVVANLAGNALKFTPSGGRIELSCAVVDADHVRFCVSDTGPGIPPEKRDFIFEKYGQLEGDKGRGFGLGLAMCRMAVELHGGRIWVESEVGKGSRFLFTVSRRLKPAAPAA
ncbi:MAG TPA: ATP-binding protein [Elusimicrobiota bacterium]|nr:ATP-binding protein [Elusimicrobiota bacterium]